MQTHEREGSSERVFIDGEWTHKNQQSVPRGLEQLAWLLDNSIPVPGTKFRIGIEPLLGLIPGIGDLIGTAVSIYIVVSAARMGVSKATLLRMAFNVGIESVIGIVPIAGDLFDAGWKANARNVELLRVHLAAPRQTTAASTAMIVAICVALLAITALLAAGVVLLVNRAVG